MKKLLLIVTAAAAISSLPAFGQGYFLFTGPVRGVWDNFSGATARPSTNDRVAFLWGSGTPSVGAIMTSVPTNSTAAFSYDAAWTAILGDANFHLALNNTDGSLAAVNSAGNGAWSYAGAGTFPVTGTAAGAFQVYVIGWNAAYADPAAAQAAHSPVGWSAPFTYNATGQLGTPLSFAQSGFTSFGVGIVPEPTTFALAGLGMAAMLIFRRRK